MSFLYFILISILQIPYFAAYDSVAMYESLANNSTCEISNDSVITWDVLDFVSIIKWKPAECATDIKDYVIQVCISIDNCQQHSHDWTSYECEKFQESKSMFSCHVNIPAEFGGKFTAPIINVSSVDMTSFTVSSRVQSGNFMCYMRYIAYELKTIKLAGDQNSCEEAVKNPNPIRSTTITREPTKADCDGQSDSLVTWSVDKLNPDSKYCVYGSYTTKITSNANGPSKVGFTSEPIITHKDIIWKSPYFIVGITAGIFFFICLVIGIKFFHYKQLAVSVPSPKITVNIDQDFEDLASQENSETERVDQLTLEFQKNNLMIHERTNHQDTQHHHRASLSDEATYLSANEEGLGLHHKPNFINKAIEIEKSKHESYSFCRTTSEPTTSGTNSTFTQDERMTGTDSYWSKDDYSPLLPDGHAYLLSGNSQFTSTQSKLDPKHQIDPNQHIVYKKIVGGASTEADIGHLKTHASIK